MRKERVTQNTPDAIYNPVEGKWEKRIRSERDIGHAYSEFDAAPFRVHDHPEVEDDGSHRRERNRQRTSSSAADVSTERLQQPVNNRVNRQSANQTNRPVPPRQPVPGPGVNKPPKSVTPGAVRAMFFFFIILLYVLRAIL